MPINITRPNAVQAVIVSIFLIGMILSPPHSFEQIQLTFTPLQQWLNFFFASNIWVLYGTSFIMLSVTTILIGRVGTRSSTMAYKGYSAMIIFLCLTLSLVDVTQTPRSLLSLLFIMISLNNIMNSRRSEVLSAGQWATAGWWIGLASLTSSESILMILIIPLGLLFHRTWNTKEFLSAIGGLLLPCALINFTYITFDITASLINVGMDNLWLYPSFFDIMSNQDTLIYNYFTYSLIGLSIFSLLGFLLSRNTLHSTLRGYIANFILLLTLTASIVLSPFFSPTTILLLYIPLSFILAKGFESKRPNLWLSTLYIVFILGAILCKYHSLIFVY